MISPRSHLRPISRPTPSTTAASRRRRPVRPNLEPLEGRALLATAAFDPTFGTGGQVFGLFGGGSVNNANEAAAVAVAGDGKIVAAGVINATGSTRTLAVRRFNSDGSVDTTFGTNGETDLPLPANTTFVVAPRNLVIKGDGSVILAATAYLQSSESSTILTTSFVAQLTPNGRLDTNFGTNGEFTLPGTHDALDAVALQTDGKIVAAGTRIVFDSNNRPGAGELLATRLTATGALDTSFNGTGDLAIAVPGVTPMTIAGYTVLTTPVVAAAPNGQIYLGVNLRTISIKNSQIRGSALARINGDGTLDTSYGSAGTLSLNPNLAKTLGGIAVQTDNKLVVAGTINEIFGPFVGPNRPSTPFLLRFNATGAADPSFVGLPLTVASTQTGVRGGFTSVVAGTDGAITAGGYTTRVTGTALNPLFAPSQFLAARYTTSGQVDSTFGVHGRMTFLPTTPAGSSYKLNLTETLTSVALAAANKVVVLGSVFGTNSAGTYTQPSFLARLSSALVLNNNTNDFDGDGKTDVAAELTNLGLYAYRKSNGTGDVLQSFGFAGSGLTIPTPGDYDGDGKPDVAAYLPLLGALAYRPSSGGNDVVDYFGPVGVGASIPTPGDYDGDGKTDVAVYLPGSGAFAIQYTGGKENQLVPFGFTGINATIPAPGDYDGDGITDIAAYLPSLGVLAYRPSSGGTKDVSIAFGSAGPGASIPAPGDYDGDGKTDVAIYLPAAGAFAIHPSSGAANYLVPFGLGGQSNTVPAPGDYDGDGKTDAAAYLPTLGLYAYRKSNVTGDIVQGFGFAGYGLTVPANSIPYSQPSSARGTRAIRVGAVTPSAAVFIPLTDDLTNPTAKKKTIGTA